MKLYRALANGLLEAHPLDAARVLESLSEAEALDVLAAAPPAVAGATVRALRPRALCAMRGGNGWVR